MFKYSALAFDINLRSEDFVLVLRSLFEALLPLHDQRDA